MKTKGGIIGSFLVILSAAVFYLSKDFPPFRGRGVVLPGPSYFPRVTAVVLLCCALIEFYQAYKAGKTGEEGTSSPGDAPRLQNFSLTAEMKTAIIGIAGMVIYALFLEKIGFQIMTTVFLIIMMLRFEVKPVKAAVYSLITVAIMVVLFERIFQVPLPPGLFRI
ncbi:MAG: tripartite tricarboxylate transporter TctB family protein [Firmicutes bacterium]|nr:tripartite tricarboxylate transporter TctB family protein [Bacillota bacterium]